MNKYTAIYRILGALVIIRWLLFLKRVSLLWMNIDVGFTGAMITFANCLSYGLVLVGGVLLVFGKRCAPWPLVFSVLLSFFGTSFSLLPFWEHLVPSSISTSPSNMRAYIIFSTYILNVVLIVALFMIRSRIYRNKPLANIAMQANPRTSGR